MADLSALTRSSRTSGASLTAFLAAMIERAVSERVTASGWRTAAGVPTLLAAALVRSAAAAVAARRRSGPARCGIVDMVRYALLRARQYVRTRVAGEGLPNYSRATVRAESSNALMRS